MLKKKLKAERMRLGISQVKMAKKYKICETTYIHLENGNIARPSPIVISKIAKYFKVTPEEVLTWL